MKKEHPSLLVPTVASIALLLSIPSANAADSISEAFSGGTPYVDVRLRFEGVEQDNALANAEALTLRTRLGYKTDVLKGFSATVEFEDSRPIFGVDDYSVPPAGIRPGEFSVIADPPTTELDQGFVQYDSGEFTGKLGRQVIALDEQRFIGPVGWRQDRQTFDAATAIYAPNEDIQLTASYVSKRNRIFAEEADVDSKDTLLNGSYDTSIGKFVAYGYLLEVDDNTENSLDTIGLSFTGSKKNESFDFLYYAEYATQKSNETHDADFLSLMGGFTVSNITAKLGYEILGTDNGAYGFSTPLATLHKFNGWSDQFLRTPNAGLKDINFSVAGNVFGGSWMAAYHDFSADESIAGEDNLGSEINLQYTRAFAKAYSAGIKYADYSTGDAVFGKVDTNKFWVWVGAKF